jgi:signal transduction histidine kinase
MVAQSVARELALFMDVLGSIRDLHALSDQISADEFAEFVDKGMRHQKRVLGPFGFIQRAPHERRAQLEQSPPGPFYIVEPDRSGGFQRAADRDEYFIVTYQVPAAGLRVPNGFDFAATEPNSTRIQNMMDNGALALGGPAPDSGTGKSYYVFAPILYDSIDGIPVVPPGYLVGFAAALISPDEILARAVAEATPRGMKVELFAEPEVTTTGKMPVSHFAHESSIDVAGRTWLLRCEAVAGFDGAGRTQRATIVLGAGLLLTAFFTAEFALMAGRTRRTERLVRERTADLQRAKERVEVEMAERRRLEAEVLEIGAREQERVGRDLHDSLGQTLTGAAFLSRALASKLADAQRPEREEAEKVNEVIKDAVGQVRRIARGLSPIEFGDESLADALQRLAEETSETYGTACKVTADETALPAGRFAAQLYHIAQEAISNAVRHGKAKQIVVALSPRELSVTDDGTGLPDDATRTGGMGLKIMKYRASVMGASLDLRRGDRGGTVLRCKF